jgi:hypothetical protein
MPPLISRSTDQSTLPQLPAAGGRRRHPAPVSGAGAPPTGFSSVSVVTLILSACWPGGVLLVPAESAGFG